MVEVAASCGVSVDTLRKIETGRIPTPALFTVAAVAATLDLSLDDLVVACAETPATAPGSTEQFRPDRLTKARWEWGRTRSDHSSNQVRDGGVS